MYNKKHFNHRNIFRGIALMLSVLTLSLAVSYLVSAWTEPNLPPPGGNAPAPLNISSTNQSKEGWIGVGGVFAPLYSLDVRDSVGLGGLRTTGGAILNTGGAATGLIVENGNVGIGTSNPQGILQVGQNTLNQVIVNTTAAVGNSIPLLLVDSDSGVGAAVGLNRWFMARGGQSALPGGAYDGGLMWIQYGPQDAPLLVLEDYDNPPRIQFQQVGAGTEVNPDNYAWIGMSGDTSNNFSIMPKTDGNVGIGTTTPQAKLHVAGNNNNNIIIESVSNDQLMNPGLLGKRARGVSLSAPQIVQVDDNLWEVLGMGYDGNSYEESSRILMNVDGAVSDGIVPGRIEFATMRADGVLGISNMIIKNNGNVGIGTSIPDQLLSVNGDASKVGGGAWLTFSDERLKNIGKNYTYGLSEISKLNPVYYKYKEDNPVNLPTSGEYAGLVAQEVQNVIPEAVEENSKGYLMLNGDWINMAMLNSIKELKAENDALRKRIEALENK